MFKVSEFAEKAGVTVRTLHHCGRRGLLTRADGTKRDIAFTQIATLHPFIVSSYKARAAIGGLGR